MATDFEREAWDITAALEANKPTGAGWILLRSWMRLVNQHLEDVLGRIAALEAEKHNHRTMAQPPAPTADAETCVHDWTWLGNSSKGFSQVPFSCCHRCGMYRYGQRLLRVAGAVS